MRNDGSLVVTATDAPVTGVARLDITHDSFVEFCAHDERRLVAIAVGSDPAGRALLASVLGRSLADHICSMPPAEADAVTISALGPAALHLARAAQLVYFGAHDDVANRPLWSLEALAEYSTFRAGSDLPLLPMSVEAGRLSTLRTAVADLEERQRSAFTSMIERVRPSVPAENAIRQQLDSALVVLRAGSCRDVEQTFHDLMLSATLGSSRGRRPIFDAQLSAPREEPELGIDRLALPAHVSLGLESKVRVSRVGLRYSLSISDVRRADGRLWFRVFTPPSEDGSPGIVHQLVTAMYDRETRKLSAVLDLLASDFEFGPVLVELVDDDGRLDPLPLRWLYWACASRSDLAVLRILRSSDSPPPGFVQQGKIGLTASSAHLSAAERTEFARIAVAAPLGFVTATIRR